MFLHIGGEKTITYKNIIGIFDLDNTTISKTTRNFLKENQKKNCVENVGKELPKSFILTKNNGKIKVYTTIISVNTLYKRVEKEK